MEACKVKFDGLKLAMEMVNSSTHLLMDDTARSEKQRTAFGEFMTDPIYRKLAMELSKRQHFLVEQKREQRGNIDNDSYPG